MIYISGKITGTEDYLARFQRAEMWLRLQGYKNIINPAKTLNTLPKMDYKVYIKLSLAMLQECDCIYMLKGWENSNGAKIEFDYAVTNKKTIYFEE